MYDVYVQYICVQMMHWCQEGSHGGSRGTWLCMSKAGVDGMTSRALNMAFNMK